jgi:hypothetical protein
VTPPMMTVPLRSVRALLPNKVTVTVPSSVPESGETLIQGRVLMADQAHVAVTAMS